MIANHEIKLKAYWSFMRAILAIFSVMFLLTGCNASIGSASYTLKNFDEKNYQALMQTIGAVGWIMGLWLFTVGFFKLKAYGQARTMMSSHATILPSLMFLFVGTVLLYLPFMTKVSLFTIWGSNDVLAYKGQNQEAWLNYFQPIVHIMTLIGYVSFIKGWMVLSRVGKEGGGQHGMASKGFMHILGGLLAINFMGTIDIIKNSF